MKNINNSYLNCFFQVCKEQQIDVKRVPDETNTYAYLLNSKGKLYKMYHDLHFKEPKEEML